MRVAALYDIHGNLPALEAVLAEVEHAAPDVVLVGGDVAAGPLPGATLDRLAALGDRVRWVMGNGDRELVEAFDAGDGPAAAEDGFARMIAWAAAQLERRQRDLLASFAPTVSLAVDGLGAVCFCHGSPRSDSEIITTLTGAGRLAPMLAGVTERVVVGGHTHRQLDRAVAGRRIVNAGAVGMPYEGALGAYWALLGPGVELRRTVYDVHAAAGRLRAAVAGAFDLDELMLRESLLAPADPDMVARVFESQAAGVSA